MGIFNFWKKEDKEQVNLRYSEYLISNPEFDPNPAIIDPEYSWGMPSGNSVVLGNQYLPDWDYGYRAYNTTGTFVNPGNYIGNSMIRCEYCGRKNKIENDFCSGCGAML